MHTCTGIGCYHTGQVPTKALSTQLKYVSIVLRKSNARIGIICRYPSGLLQKILQVEEILCGLTQS